MKYLSLNNDEVRELKFLLKVRLNKFIIMSISSLIVFFIISSFIFSRLKISGYYVAHVSTAIAGSVFMYYVYHSFKNYFLDLREKRKKVYTGVLSRKYYKIESDSYVFHMDGNKFSVSKSDFDSFIEGDKLEFHISPYSKHIFRIEKYSGVA